MLADLIILGVIPSGGAPPPPVVTTPASRTLVVGALFCRLSDFQVQPDGIPIIDQAPLAEASLDYREDWSHWLADDEEISGVVWTVAAGLTTVSEGFDETGVTIWLTGGVAGSLVLVEATITTDQTRVDTRSFRVRVVNR